MEYQPFFELFVFEYPNMRTIVLSKSQLESIMYLLKPRYDQEDFYIENMKILEIIRSIQLYEYNNGFCKGSCTCINFRQYTSITERLEMTSTNFGI